MGTQPLDELTLMRRFWTRARVDETTGCWDFTGYVDRNGYGRGEQRGEPSAHRHAYRLVKGPIPAGMHVDHLCRNRRCMNPAHLEAVTPGENSRRANAARRADRDLALRLLIWLVNRGDAA